MRITNHSSC